MKRFLVIAVLLLAGAAPAAVPAVAWAQPSYGGQARLVPLSRVIASIAARTPGRHLNASQGEAGGRPAYYVQWQLPDGRVVVFVVDAESGQIIGRQGG